MKLTASAREEILVLFSTANVLYRTSKWEGTKEPVELVYNQSFDTFQRFD
jgi:hypothetical protein